MIYDLNLYRHSVLPLVRNWCDYKPDQKPHQLLGEIALITSCPIVVVACFIIELYGESPELTRQLKVLKTFYKVERIEGKI